MVFFTFEFDRPDRRYKVGDRVSCKITVHNSSKFKARSLSIRFKGYAHTQWQKSGTGSKSKTYSGDEEYFKRYRYMFGSRTSTTNHEVPEGTHVYESSYVLPPYLPSSFEATKGHVKFDVKAKYDIAFGFDKSDRGFFFVTADMDLNEFPHLREPVKKVEQKTFGCFCFTSEPMQLINIIPKSGVVPGDTLPLEIRINNGSDVHCKCVRVKLIENITFTTKNPSPDTKRKTKTINEHVVQTAVEPFQNKVIHTSFYLDPSFDWKMLKECDIINASYCIKSEAVTSGLHFNMDNTTGITIGTIPLNELPSINEQNDQTIPVFNPTAPADAYMEQPLPSYNEAASEAPSPIAGGSGNIGWNMPPSRVPLASTEKMYMDDMPPPSFNDSQSSPIVIAAETGESIPSAPNEQNPTAPTQ